MATRMFKVINLVVAAFFAYALVVQYNDPDPLLWMIIYGLTSLACVLFHLGRLPASAAAGFGGLVVLLGLYLAYRVISQQQFFFDEEGREMMGSFLVALWMALLWRRARQQPEAKGT